MAQKKNNKKSKTDKFFGTRYVTSLQEETFGDFLSDQDVALVMFYSPKNPHSHLSRTHFVKAVKSSRKDNVTFAAVNCDEERRLCLDENVRSLPDFKIYSRGRLVSNQGVMTDYRQIMKVVDESPILPPKPVSKTIFR